MARYGRVEGIERRVENGATVTYVKVDTGGGDPEEVQHLEAPGEDSPPVIGDFAGVDEVGDSGTKQTNGYFDPKGEAKSANGEKRYVSRTEQGEKIAELWMAHGAVTLKVFDPNVPVFVEGAKVVIKSPDVNLGGEGGRGVMCIGDLSVGSVRALCGAPGSPIIPVPPATPTATGGVPLAVQGISGRSTVKAREGA